MHPGSAAALCVARDLASTRGASVTALCAGDGGEFDGHIERAASRFGADQLYFVGPSGIASMYRRLLPRHVFAPWSPNAISTLASAGIPAPTPHLLSPYTTDSNTLEPTVAVVASHLPWHDLDPDAVEAEFEPDCGSIALPPWVTEDAHLAPGGSVVYAGPPDLDDDCRVWLERIGARSTDPSYANAHRDGTLVWLDAGPAGLPAALADRPAHARVILLPGPTPSVHETWKLADYVLPGPWATVLESLTEQKWQSVLH